MPTPAHPARERGSMLIVAMGVLTLVALIAVAFGILMRLEQSVASAYVDTVRARVLAQAGVDSVLGEIEREIALRPFSDPDSPLVYNPDQEWLPDFSVPLEEIPSGRASYSQVLGSTHGAEGVDRFKVKAIDANTMININDRYPTLPVVLNGLGQAIARLQDVPDPINGQGQLIKELRDRNYGGRFESKIQLREIIGDEAYRRVRDYITTHSWVDVKAVMPARDSIFNPSESVKRGKVQFVLPEGTPPGQAEIVGFGGRAPINVNQAPKEVLVAVIYPVGGRRAYHPVPNLPPPVPIDQGVGGTPSIPGFLEETSFEEIYFRKPNLPQWRPYQWVFVPPYWQQQSGLERAIALADLIVRERTGKTSSRGPVRGPFQSMADFERWVDEIPNNAPVFPSPDEVVIPTERGMMSKWGPIRGHPDYRRWHYQTVKSIIKANFNPNALVNSFNPSSAAWRPVDKANLLFPAAEQLQKTDTGGQSNPVGDFISCQSVDFCLGNMGYWEITSLGEVAGPGKDAASVAGAVDAEEERPLYGLAKVRTVVQVQGVVRHTTQQDFERNDHHFNVANRKRRGVRTHPENDMFWEPGDGTGSRTGTGREACPQFGYVELDTGLTRPPGARPRRNISIGGGVRPDPIFELTMDKRPEQVGDFKMWHGFLPRIAGGIPQTMGPLALPWGSAVYGQHEVKAQRTTATFVLAGGTLMPDGFRSTMRDGGAGATSDPATLWYRAADTTGVQDPREQGLSAESDDAPVNIPMHSGTIEFWYKPDFDWSFWDENNHTPTEANPIFCGLFQATHITRNPDIDSSIPENASGAPTRAKQMFVFRNTSGDIRIVRLYSELIGLDIAGKQMPYLRNPAYPDPSLPNGDKEFLTVPDYVELTLLDPASYPWPPVDLEILQYQSPDRATFARVDFIVPYDLLRFWRAHEWHHIAISYEDGGGGQSTGNDPLNFVRVFVDGEIVDDTSRINYRMIGQKGGLSGEQAGEFVRLNHHPQPENQTDPRLAKDGMFVGCIHRRQAARAGVFKFDDEITFGANGTVDDIRVYRESIREGVEVARPTDRYLPGVYEQRFEIPFPGNVERLRLGRLDFTAYLPGEYDDADPQKFGAGRVEVFVARNDQILPSMARGWVFNENQMKGGFALTTDPGGLTPKGKPVFIERGDRITYQVHLYPARNSLGNVASPVLDDVTLTYYLPKARVLHQEEVLE